MVWSVHGPKSRHRGRQWVAKVRWFNRIWWRVEEGQRGRAQASEWHRLAGSLQVSGDPAERTDWWLWWRQGNTGLMVNYVKALENIYDITQNNHMCNRTI